jgi:MYXO-CTERM domain-containing protein
MRIATLSIATALLLGGCTSEIAFTDSVSSRYLQATPRAEFGDELSTPYVLGSEFTVHVEDRQRDENMVGWTVRVTDPAVLTLRDPEPRWLDKHTLALDVKASGVGSAELLLVDASGEIKGSAAVEVRMPTRVKLYATAIAALENADFRGETPHPRVLTGGTASFAVQYLADDLLLQGSTDLKLAHEPTIVAEVVHSQLADNRDILQLTVGDPGRDTIGLWLGEWSLGTVDVEVVGPSEVAAIDLIEHKGSVHEDEEGDWLVVAQAYNEMRQPIYGVGFEWSFPDRSFEQVGDILIYEYDPDPSKRKDVVARAAGREAKISLPAADGEVYTSNDEAFNCSVGERSGAPLWAMVLLACAGLRRRRPR